MITILTSDRTNYV